MNINATNLTNLTNIDYLSPANLPNNSSTNSTIQDSNDSNDNNDNLLTKTSELAFSASFFSNQINNQLPTQQTINKEGGGVDSMQNQDSSSQPPVETSAALDAARNLK